MIVARATMICSDVIAWLWGCPLTLNLRKLYAVFQVGHFQYCLKRVNLVTSLYLHVLKAEWFRLFDWIAELQHATVPQQQNADHLVDCHNETMTTRRLWISLWREDFCTGVGAPPKITRRMWKWSAKRCKGKLINVRRRKPRISTENSTPKKYCLWRKKGGNIEGLLNWNGHLARLQWCMASTMIHGKTPFQHAWFILLKAMQENWNRRKK